MYYSEILAQWARISHVLVVCYRTQPAILLVGHEELAAIALVGLDVRSGVKRMPSTTCSLENVPRPARESGYNS